MADLFIVKFWEDPERLRGHAEVDLYAACEAMGIRVYTQNERMTNRRLGMFVYPTEFVVALNAAQDYDANGFHIMSYVEFTKAYLEFASYHMVPERLYADPVVIAPEFALRRIRL